MDESYSYVFDGGAFNGVCISLGSPILGTLAVDGQIYGQGEPPQVVEVREAPAVLLHLLSEVAFSD